MESRSQNTTSNYGKNILNYYQADNNVYAGEYPYAINHDVGLNKLNVLNMLGISFIVDLTEVGELVPYNNYLYDRCRYLRFPIEDTNTPNSVDSVIDICCKIRQALDEGLIIYIHCWGGVGRTGTIVACWYVFNGLSASEAIEKLNIKWKECPKSNRRHHCPQYKHQANFVHEFELSLRNYLRIHSGEFC